MNLETVTGLVLSAMPIGEYDKRLVILSKERGKISAFAKGARRQNSTFMACSQPFSFGQFTIYQGKNSYTINSVQIQNYFEDLRTDLEKVTYGMYFCEVASYLTYENIESTGLLKLLYQSLKALGNDKLPKELVRAVFELKALDFNGETPQVFACVKCREKTEGEYLKNFSAKMGGLLCENCKSLSNDVIMVSPPTVYALQHITTSSVEKLYTFILKEAFLQELICVAKAYMKCYVNGNFQSLQMLDIPIYDSHIKNY